VIERLALAVPAPAPAPLPAAPAPPPPEPPKPPKPKAKPNKPEPAAAESSGGGVRILVSIPEQKLWVFEGPELVATSPVSTGRKGHETPAGRFRILQKKVHHRSTTYDNAPMPYMQRLTWYGVALHAGRLPGYPASHGCIRLPRGFAKKLYGLTDYGTRVTVTMARPKSVKEARRLA
jgi:lipoprotein-anchoring transpeptidase ErfK/SrfK